LVHEINNANGDVIEYAYTHQPDGQIDTLVLDRDVDDVQSSETYDFDYDQQGQLTQVDYTGTGAGVDESYQYDSNGNRTGAAVGTSSSVYTPGAYNRLESVDDGTTVTVFGYDPEGNLVLRFVDDGDGVFGANDTNIVEYVWDHRNRLVSVTNYDTFGGDSTQQVYYRYDYLNRMISRTVDADGAGTTHSPATEYFVYDHDASTNWGLSQSSSSENGTVPFGADPSTDSGQIVLHLDETGAPTHRYLWGPAVDMLLADEAVDSGVDQTPGTADDVRWTLGDHQNSVRDILVLDDNSTPGYPDDDEWIVGNHVTYDAWGNTVAETDAAISGLFGWTGRPRDKLTGLQNNGNRWYDAVLAHWQSEDPIGFEGGDANLQRYCGNDPVNRVDPSGLVLDRVRKAGIGALIGLAECGRALTYPARWVGVDFSKQDRLLEELWDQTVSPREKEYTKRWTKGAATTSAVAAGAALGGPTIVQGGRTVAGGISAAGSKAYAVGTLTASQVQQLIASSGDKVVTVFTRLTQSPAANRMLSASTDPRLADQARKATMYVGRIPADLFHRLVAEGEITYATTEMHGVRGTEVIFSSRAMQILAEYFTKSGGALL